MEQREVPLPNFDKPLDEIIHKQIEKLHKKMSSEENKEGFYPTHCSNPLHPEGREYITVV